jgi:prevent-host-death family protein
VILKKTALVTTLKRQATNIIDELREDKEPVLITQHGAPAAYLVDVENFEKLNRRMSVLEGLAIGESAIKAGRTKSQKEAKKRMARWLK